MTKKLFILAIIMLLLSLAYYGVGRLDSTADKVSAETSTRNNGGVEIVATATLEFEGIYTTAVNEKDCETKKMTLEILASSTSYLTEEFMDCKTPVEMKSWEGGWQDVGGKLVINLKNSEQSQTFNLSVDKNGKSIKLNSTEPTAVFTKTNLKNYKSEYKNISAEYGQYGKEYFVRLWSPNGVLLTTLLRDSGSDSRYTDGTYVWMVGATSTLLSASSTSETFIEQTNEQN